MPDGLVLGSGRGGGGGVFVGDLAEDGAPEAPRDVPVTRMVAFRVFEGSGVLSVIRPGRRFPPPAAGPSTSIG